MVPKRIVAPYPVTLRVDWNKRAREKDVPLRLWKLDAQDRSEAKMPSATLEAPMDEMRQSVEGFAYEGSGGDVSDLCRAGLEARLSLVPRGDHWGGDLARLVEAEIIPRLMIVHRPESHAAIGIILPSPEQIETFSTLMLAPAEDEVEARIAALIDKGLTPESLLLDLLAPTARHLGVLWEEDLCDFTEVTVAMGRLQRIMHEVTRRFGGETPQHRHGRSILLLPCPGEQHSFGLAVVEQFFRDAGWDVTSTVRDPGGDPLARVRTTWFDVIGLSLACEALLPTLVNVVAGLRRHSQNRAVRVMVGGPVFTADPDSCKCVGADATAGDARHAISTAESLLDLPARPC
jgi:methanogenic corrinoid protein MtbC1